MTISVSNLTPREIVAELNRYIIGQDRAKRTVAIALRNRWRRSLIEDSNLREEIIPRNIMMSGPTGVGKTEIARRLAQIADAPFVKVEATKFTEVGYVGRDVESMIKDLVKNAINIMKRREIELVRERASDVAEERILSLLGIPDPNDLSDDTEDYESRKKRQEEYRDKNRKKLEAGEFDDRFVNITVESKNIPVFEISSGMNSDDMDSSIRDMMGSIFPTMKKEKKFSVKEALEHIINEEAQKMLDMDKIQQDSLQWAEQCGIIFIDEIDKVVAKSSSSHGPDVSREGVQRDILPIVEGSTVNTKYGPIKTDHILFIAAGAFHMTSPEDLIPELQGRFPLSATLDSLSVDDFEKILTEPEHSLVKQYTELLKAEKVTLVFKKEAIKEIAKVSYDINNTTQNIGARRLQTIMERILEDISFTAPDMGKQKVTVDVKFVKGIFTGMEEKEKLNNYII